jgi:hypothetical protein
MVHGQRLELAGEAGKELERLSRFWSHNCELTGPRNTSFPPRLNDGRPHDRLSRRSAEGA